LISRGEVVVSEGALRAKAGSGRWLSRTGGPAAEPTGKLVLEMDPERNFGATIL
jgi:dihydropyrimidinase